MFCSSFTLREINSFLFYPPNLNLNLFIVLLQASLESFYKESIKFRIQSISSWYSWLFFILKEWFWNNQNWHLISFFHRSFILYTSTFSISNLIILYLNTTADGPKQTIRRITILESSWWIHTHNRFFELDISWTLRIHTSYLQQW